MREIFLYGVEYCNDIDDDSSTFEIFEDENQANDFIKNIGNDYIYKFTAMFDNELIYTEDNGSLNYEDTHDLMKDFKILDENKNNKCDKCDHYGRNYNDDCGFCGN